MPSRLTIFSAALGDFATNCFVVHAEGGRDCWIVDAGYQPAELLHYVEDNDLRPAKIVLTHAHCDHIGGLEEVHRQWPDVPILIHEDEAGFIAEPMLNLSAMMGMPLVAPAATDLLKHGDTLQLDDLSFEIRHTPGHSPGGILLHQPDNQVAIVGDTLFAGSIGRYDFPTSDGRRLMKSIREQLLTLPDETEIYPGHGPASTIAAERATNPFVLHPPPDMV